MHRSEPRLRRVPRKTLGGVLVVVAGVFCFPGFVALAISVNGMPRAWWAAPLFLGCLPFLPLCFVFGPIMTAGIDLYRDPSPPEEPLEPQAVDEEEARGVLDDVSDHHRGMPEP